MPPLVFLGLGSSLGAREATLAQALLALDARGFCQQRVSSLYLTEPVGGPPQEWYVNQVVTGQASLSPEELLEGCHDVERAFGRVRGEKNAAPTLDLDLLFRVNPKPTPVKARSRVEETRLPFRVRLCARADLLSYATSLLRGPRRIL